MRIEEKEIESAEKEVQLQRLHDRVNDSADGSTVNAQHLVT